jgi:hypothetical protein
MKRCWPWAHHWQRDYDLESRQRDVSRFNINAQRCEKCGRQRMMEVL